MLLWPLQKKRLEGDLPPTPTSPSKFIQPLSSPTHPYPAQSPSPSTLHSFGFSSSLISRTISAGSLSVIFPVFIPFVCLNSCLSVCLYEIVCLCHTSCIVHVHIPFVCLKSSPSVYHSSPSSESSRLTRSTSHPALGPCPPPSCHANTIFRHWTSEEEVCKGGVAGKETKSLTPIATHCCTLMHVLCCYFTNDEVV